MEKLPCPPELWPAFSRLLDEALELAEPERRRWLAALDSRHETVRPWLVRVLAGGSDTLDETFLKAPKIEEAGDAGTDFRSGQHIGPYLLERRLGSGGMGEVWLASRGDGTLKRQIALKLPHAHLLLGVVRRRFERERDILARLSHPNIAQLYDAGVDGSQHPFLAMEWVDGMSIIEHCRAGRVPLEGRLTLFLQILDAVGYAHGRLVAHRDLKPSNILVTRDGRIKLLDFGIAKLLRGDSEDGATQLTRLNDVVATPGYAAPEQLAGMPITVAVDLYSLGVILHELLTGRRPVRENPHGVGAPQDMARASSLIDPKHAAHVGGLEPRELRRALQGDLDAIIAKALQFDANRRYRTAEAVAQDLELSRQHRPISARHINAVTIAAKFVRRHSFGAAMSLGFILVLLIGTIGIAWQAVRAEREAHRATAIKDFLIGVFRASDPRIAADKPRGEITARELLDISSQQIEAGFAQQPETQIELLGVTADIYRELDETQRSTALYAREAELARRQLGPADPRTIDGLLGQAYNAENDGDDVQALAFLAQADPLILGAGLDKSAARARWLTLRGEELSGRAATAAQAKASLEQAVRLFETTAGKDSAYPQALLDLGDLALEHSQYPVAADYYQQAISLTEPDPQAAGDLLVAYNGLAASLKMLGDFDHARLPFERGIKIAARTYGLDNHKYRSIASTYAQFRYDRGEREDALAEFADLERRLPRERTGFRNATEALEAAQVLRKFGRCLATDGQAARSIELLERAAALLATSRSRANDGAQLQFDLAKAYDGAGRPDAARSAFPAAMKTLEADNAPAARRAELHERWAQFLFNQQELDAADREFNTAILLAADRSIPAAIYAQAGLASLAVAKRDPGLAASTSRLALEKLDHIEGYYDIRIKPYVWSARARALLLIGDRAGAADYAKRVSEAVRRWYSPDSPVIAQSAALTAELTRFTAAD